MVSRAIDNPFAQTIVKDPWSEPIDVAAINAEVSRAICSELEAVRRTLDSRGVVVVGQAGTGKTHLVARLRRDLERTRAGCLADIPPIVGDPGRFARHVLYHLVASLTRPPRAPLRELFQTFLIARVVDTRERPVHLNRARLRALIDKAGNLVREVAPTADLDVLAALAAGVRGHEPLARRWLLGEELAAADLELLELHRCIASEDDALRAIETTAAIARLAEPPRVLVFAFDQVDAYLDPARRQRFAEVAAELIHRPNHLVLTMCLIATWQDIERDVKTPLVQRLTRGGLPPLEMRALTMEEIKLVIEQRLERAFGPAPRPSPYHPFSANDLAAFAALAPGRVPARAALNEARLRFDQWQQHATADSADSPLVARIKDALEQDGIAVEAAPEPFDLLARGARDLAIAVLGSLDGQSWRRLARIEQQRVERALIVHARGLRPGEHAVKTRELLKRLRRGEHSHVIEASDDLAALLEHVRDATRADDAAVASTTLEQEIAALLATRRVMNLAKLRAALAASATEAATLAAVKRLAERGAVECRQYHDEVEVRWNPRA